MLASAYRRSLELASTQGIRTLAFPAISAGVYGYPMREAAQIALHTTLTYLQDHPEIEMARFVLFGSPAYEVYQAVWDDILSKGRA